MEYTSAKGVFDILPSQKREEDKWKEVRCWQYLEQVMRGTAHDYGFEEIRTPIFERTELFVRGVGETSDIVSKEMYTFLDRAERSMTLRPEGTAAVMRSIVEHKLYSQTTLHKYYYLGPMFRYERPQAGRYRQHHQFGIEAIGIGKPEQDVEVIDMVCEMYRRLGLKHLTIQINSVGDPISRQSYKEALCQYLAPHFTALSPDSQVRFEKNILRILDSKDPQDQKLLQNAPIFSHYLTEDAKAHFDAVLHLLSKLKLDYVVNPKLVRGLDYYTKTVFEITTEDLGAQNSLGGGGRYDGLISAIGGPDLPGIGYATGIERLLQTMLKQQAPLPLKPHPCLFLIPLGQQATERGAALISALRHARIPCEIDLSGKKVQHGLQLANQLGAEYALVLGEEEIQSGQGTLKVMATRQTIAVQLDQILPTLKDLLGLKKEEA